MTPFRMLALVLVALLTVMAATPARAEAMETTTILLIATAGVAIVIVIVYLIVANMQDGPRRAGVPADGTPPGAPIGGTRLDGASSAPTPVAVTSYVVTSPALDPAAVAATVQGQ